MEVGWSKAESLKLNLVHLVLSLSQRLPQQGLFTHHPAPRGTLQAVADLWPSFPLAVSLLPDFTLNPYLLTALGNFKFSSFSIAK